MVPTGGVTLDNAAEFFKAGASAIAVGSELVSKKALESGDFRAIEKTAKQFLKVVKEARG
jgi:2-dehydro-3-deoxyphosphogluconate aldolase/(4S)-4-hydroxy-2-oxoglutarate aldolase